MAKKGLERLKEICKVKGVRNMVALPIGGGLYELFRGQKQFTKGVTRSRAIYTRVMLRLSFVSESRLKIAMVATAVPTPQMPANSSHNASQPPGMRKTVMKEQRDQD